MSEQLVFDAGSGGGSYTSSYNAEVFYVNVDNISTLINNLKLCADSLNNTINGIIYNTEKMSDGWEGEDYTSYRNSINRYAPYLRTFIFFIEAYMLLLTDLSVNATTLCSTVQAALEK